MPSKVGRYSSASRVAITRMSCFMSHRVLRRCGPSKSATTSLPKETWTPPENGQSTWLMLPSFAGVPMDANSSGSKGIADQAG